MCLYTYTDGQSAHYNK